MTWTTDPNKGAPPRAAPNTLSFMSIGDDAGFVTVYADKSRGADVYATIFSGEWDVGGAVFGGPKESFVFQDMPDGTVTGHGSRVQIKTSPSPNWFEFCVTEFSATLHVVK